MASIPSYRLSGRMVRRLMRKHGHTIRSLANRFKVTMKRVREVREDGARGFAAVEWHFLLTGIWLDLVAEEPTAVLSAI